MNIITFTPYLLEIILGIISIGLLASGYFIHKKTNFYITILITTLTLFIIILAGTSLRFDGYDFFNIRNLIVTLVVISSLILLQAYESYALQQNYELPIFLMFTMIGAIVALGANNLLELFIAIELYSISLYFIIVYDKTKTTNTKVNTRYITVGMASSAVILFGISLIYGYSINLDFITIGETNNAGVSLGLAFIIIGILIKLGVVPFHLWLPDTYENLILPIISIFAVLGQMLFILTLFKFTNIINYAPIIEIISIITIIIGSFGALNQTNIKKLIAYLVILSSGYALIPLVIASNATYSHLILHLLTYAFAMIGFIALTSSFRFGNKTITETSELSGLSQNHPIRAGLFIFFLASLLGIPPLGGFFTKIMILTDAYKENHITIVIFAILTMIINIILLVRFINILFFEKSEPNFFILNKSLQFLMFISFIFCGFFIFLLPHLLFFIRGISI